jgi:hypothetical protein
MLKSVENCPINSRRWNCCGGHLYFCGSFRNPRDIREFENPRGGDNGSFCDVRMTCDLMVFFHQIYCREDFPARKLCKIGNVPKGILIGDGYSIQSTIVVTASPAVLFLGDEVEGRKPGAIGTPHGTVLEQLLELRIRDSEAARC